MKLLDQFDAITFIFLHSIADMIAAGEHILYYNCLIVNYSLGTFDAIKKWLQSKWSNFYQVLEKNWTG